MEEPYYTNRHKKPLRAQVEMVPTANGKLANCCCNSGAFAEHQVDYFAKYLTAVNQ